MIRFDLLILIALWLTYFSDARKLHQYGKGESSFFFTTLNDAQLNGNPQQKTGDHWAQPSELSASVSSAPYSAGHSRQSSRGHPAQPELSASASSAPYAAEHHSKQSSQGHPVQPPEPRASASIASYFAGSPRQSRSRGSRVLHCEQVDYCVCRIGLQESS